MVVTIVTLGRGSDGEVGRNSQYTRTCPGLNKQNIRSAKGRGSQIANSHTSRSALGCALESTELEEMMLDIKRSGEADDRGEESTRTRCAEGVEGGLSIEASNNR